MNRNTHVLGRAGRRLRAILAAVAVSTSAVVVQTSAPAAAAPPPNFSEVVAFSGLASPTAVRFAPDGGVFVAEKRGVIKRYDGLGDATATVVADLRTEVHNFWDRGLLGLAVDPEYPTRPYLYALYTFDGPIGGTAPRWGTPNADSDPCPNPPGATADGCVVSGKLVRLRVDAANPSASSTVKQDLVHDWCQQYPSHSIGDLVFGPNRTLYVSGGEGASFTFLDYGQDGNPVNPCGDPPGGAGGAMTPPTAQGGALRAQDLRTPGDPVSLSGTVIRVSPDTGLALPSNPNAAATTENARRVVAYGLRNPFRMTVRPGTDEVWIGDVGRAAWEEINRLVPTTRPVKNFGWPCYEGPGRQAAFDALNLKLCEDLYAQAGAVTAPYYPYRHKVPLNAADNCNVTGGSSTSGISFQFYTGGAYPAEYDGALFFSDYSRRCIWVMTKGTDGLPDKLKARPFVTAAAGPVDLELSPRGELFYADLDGGTVRRIIHGAGPTSCPAGQFLAEYFSGTTPSTSPVVRTCETAPLAHDWGSGAPAGVGPDNFSARWTGTFDFPTAADYTFTADADDGMRVWVDGTLLIDEWRVQARTTFSATRALTAGSHTVRVEWFDGSGPAVANLRWSAGSAPQPEILTPAAGTTWQVGEAIRFTGSATDPEDGALPASALSWAMVLQHCPSGCHEHPLQTWAGVSGGSIAAPDHEYPSHLVLELTATDSHGQSTTVRRRLDPRTVPVTLASQPTGLQLTLGGRTAAAPVTGTVIQGGTTSVSAPAQQTLAGATYTFSRWSDGGAASHDVTATSARTLTATYALTACPRGQYRAQYYANATLTGTPVRTVCEAAPLNRGWAAGGPQGLPTDNFSVRWNGSFSFVGGSTTFSGSSDDGMRVWLDGALVVDRWTTAGPWTVTRSVTAGVHQVRVDYVERTGNAFVRLSWSP